MPGDGYTSDSNRRRENQAQTDDVVMSLVELAMARPEAEREECLRRACGTNSRLFDQVWNYLQWEKRMEGFMADPFRSAPPAAEEFQPGRLLIGRFRLVREIARGGMGIVWEAIDEKLDRRVALKWAQNGFDNRLLPEVRNAREISHPSVCKIFEIHTVNLTAGPVDFISMEFVEGETLAKRLEQGPLTKAEALSIARDLCAGLAEAHHHQVIHADLKTQNVILTPDGYGSVRAVIMDFGLARALGNKDRAMASAILAGTPDYMAPELWTGSKASVTSDIYALGVILSQLSTRTEASFIAKTRSTLVYGQPEKPQIPLGGGRWNRVVMRCMDSDPVKRYQSATEVAKALTPTQVRRPAAIVAAAMLLAAISSLISYQRALPHKQAVRLAIAPFTSDRKSAAVANQLTRASFDQLEKLDARGFRLLPLKSDSNDATHTLHGTVQQQGGKTTVHVFVADAESVVVKDWTAEYDAAEAHHAPVAVAGVVTEALRLPPLVRDEHVNATAGPFYEEGLKALASDMKSDTAIAMMTKAAEADPESPLTAAGLAEAQWLKYHLTNDGNWVNQAVATEAIAEERNPDVPEVHMIAGRIQSQAGSPEEAITEYKRAIELDPRSGEGHRRLGLLYESNNQKIVALEELKQAVSLAPNDFRTYGELGAYYFYNSDYESARENFKESVRIAPGEINAWRNLIGASIDLGLYESAESEARAGLRVSETPGLYLQLGQTFLYRSREREAIPPLRRAVSINPQYEVGWQSLGICYRRVGDRAEATRAFRRGLQLAERDVAEVPRDGRARSRLAYLCAATGATTRAVSEIRQAIQFAPENATVLFQAVMTYEELHMRAETLSVLRRAPDQTIADVNRWPDLADLHRDSRFLALVAERGKGRNRGTNAQ